jgi:hypothetical protein
MNAAIFWATKNPPDLRAGYAFDFIVKILVAGARNPREFLLSCPI